MSCDSKNLKYLIGVRLLSFHPKRINFFQKPKKLGFPTILKILDKLYETKNHVFLSKIKLRKNCEN